MPRFARTRGATSSAAAACNEFVRSHSRRRGGKRNPKRNLDTDKMIASRGLLKKHKQMAAAGGDDDDNDDVPSFGGGTDRSMLISFGIIGGPAMDPHFKYKDEVSTFQDNLVHEVNKLVVA